MISEVYAPYYGAAGTLDTNLEIQLTTGEWEVHYIEKWNHHVCRRVLCIIFILCQWQVKGQGKKQTFECQ